MRFGCSQHIYQTKQEEAPRGSKPSRSPCQEPHHSGNISQIFSTGGRNIDLPWNRPARWPQFSAKSQSSSRWAVGSLDPPLSQSCPHSWSSQGLQLCCSLPPMSAARSIPFPSVTAPQDARQGVLAFAIGQKTKLFGPSKFCQGCCAQQRLSH